MRLSMCSERDRDREHDGRARPASRERQPAKPAKKERWAHLITRRRDMPRRRICRLRRRRLSGDVRRQDPGLCVILRTLLLQTGRLVVRKVAVRERAESFVCAADQVVDFTRSIPHQPLVVVRHEARAKAELRDKAKCRLLETVVLVRCDGRSRLRHPSPPDDVDADICKFSRKIYVSFFWGVRPRCFVSRRVE